MSIELCCHGKEEQMDLTQVTEMKNSIIDELQRMEKLKQSMENTLAGLIQWEKHLQKSGPAASRAPRKKPVVLPEIQPIPQGTTKTIRITPGERVERALGNMHGEFTRSQLLAETEGDGKGELGSGSFGGVFLRLLKNQRIRCVKGSPSKRDSLYVRSSEAKTDQAFLD
jgi:hypothetical protein